MNQDNNVVNNTQDNNGIPNNQSLNNQNSNNSSSKKKNIIILLLSIVIFCLVGYLVYDKLVLDKNIENDIKDNNSPVIEDEDNDIYGYAQIEYAFLDGTFNGDYKIVELHKNSKDKVLVSYDGINTINEANRIDGMKIVKDKMYYQLYYNTHNGYDPYSNIMCIDLNSERKEPVELLNWKDAENDSTMIIREFKITDNYIYINTTYDKYYKYNIKNKEFIIITQNDYETIEEPLNINNKIFHKNKIYLNGKELLINEEKEVIYNGETVYKSDANDIVLLYSFDSEIVIQEDYCEYLGCNHRKYYKYSFESKQMEEIDYFKNPYYQIIVNYK